MRSLPIIAAFAAGMLAACSKSPIDSATSAANAVGMKLMAPAMRKDASHQAEGLIRALASRPECQEFINRLREAGHGSPYEGATQLVLVHTYDAAGKAGCVRQD